MQNYVQKLKFGAGEVYFNQPLNKLTSLDLYEQNFQLSARNLGLDMSITRNAKAI